MILLKSIISKQKDISIPKVRSAFNLVKIFLRFFCKTTYMKERKNTLTVSSLIQEVIWPSRCAICDTYGENPCQHCKDNFPFLDYWQACPFCGAPYGRFLCSECDGMHSRNLPEAKLGFAQCRSVCTLTDTSFK